MSGSKTRALLVASFPDSILHFRGALISALQQNGVDVHVAAPDLPPESNFRVQLESRGVSVHEIPLHRAGMNPVADIRTLLHLQRLMRTLRPDLVLAYTIKPVIYGSFAAWLAGVPHRYALITGLGYTFQGEGKRGAVRGLVQRLYRLALNRVHKVFFQNVDDQALFRERGIIAPHAASIVVNGSGVDLDDYQAQPLVDGPVRFLMIGRLLGDKGVREYAQAAQRVHSEHPRVRFGLVGWLDENPDAIGQPELEDWISQGAIEFHGRLDDVRPAIADCSVYVLPSYREGTPRTVLEAMAMGRAVITTDAPGCRGTVIHEDNGFLVPVKSVDALVEAMLRFIDSPGLAVRMGRRSRQLAVEKYDVHKVNDVMLREMGIVGQAGALGHA